MAGSVPRFLVITIHNASAYRLFPVLFLSLTVLLPLFYFGEVPLSTIMLTTSPTNGYANTQKIEIFVDTWNTSSLHNTRTPHTQQHTKQDEPLRNYPSGFTLNLHESIPHGPESWRRGSL